jgi:hypothetical protein
MDLIKFIEDLMARIRFGNGHMFTWHPGGDYTGGDVEMLLRGYGIACYARQYALWGQDYGITVQKRQAHWAEYLLCKANVPLTCQLLDARHSKMLDGKMPSRWSKRKRRPVDWSGWLCELLASDPAVLRNAPVRKKR